MKMAEEILDKHVVSHDKGRGLVILNDTYKISVINAMEEYARMRIEKALKELKSSES